MRSILLLICLGLLACGNAKNTESSDITKQEKKEIRNQESIENKRWVLKTLSGKNIPAHKKDIFITYKNAGAFNGNGGCNSFGGSYTIKDQTISMTDIFHTQMACNMLPTENDFFKALETADGYKILKDQLYLYKGKEEIAYFEAVYLK